MVNSREGGEGGTGLWYWFIVYAIGHGVTSTMPNFKPLICDVTELKSWTEIVTMGSLKSFKIIAFP